MKLSAAILSMLDAKKEYDRWHEHMEELSHNGVEEIEIDGATWSREMVSRKYHDACANLQFQQGGVDAIVGSR